ncbi:MAG: tRNA-guanine transglycosylase, partial [Spirochaetes bacterium]|nr:tRNA-guanine transglycosylase [Spirochaetota bacterium]
MKFTITANDRNSKARAGELTTVHSKVKTPVFMPVATRGAVRAMTRDELQSIGFDIILANTYHIYLRPGTGVIEAAGGLHNFMNYGGSLLTDSGGF